MYKCSRCNHKGFDKGRAFDGRRAYRCQNCGHSYTYGLQGRVRKYSVQRMGYQFHDTGASRQNMPELKLEELINEFAT